MFAPYTDVFLLPLPKRKLAAYRRMARSAGKVFRDLGAIEYREFVADDLTARRLTAFPKVVKLKAGEVLIFAVVGFRSRAHRDRTNRRIMADPRLGKMMTEPLMFEMKRMVYGGFRNIVDV